MATAIKAKGLPPSLSSFLLLLPPNIAAHFAMLARKVIAPAIVAATVPIKISLLCTCPSSCPMTPESSSSSTISISPLVTATAA